VVRKGWSQERIEQVRRMASEGMTVREIADRIGLTHEYVRRYIKQYGIQMIRHHAFTGEADERKQILQDYINRGMSVHQISKDLGVSSYTVKKMMEIYGFELHLKAKTIRWTTELLDELFRLKQVMSLDALAAHFGTSAGAIRGAFNTYQCYEAPEVPKEQDLPPLEYMTKINVLRAIRALERERRETRIDIPA
jgi:transposase